MDEEFKQKYGFGVITRYIQEKEKEKDKGGYKLSSGMNLDGLGIDVQKQRNPGMPVKLISPFIDDNATQPDPLVKPPEWLKQKIAPKVNRKKEMFSQFTDETHFYIFYNVMDEEQQLWAVENLYNKGWRYNYKREQWFRDLQQIKNNLFQGKYFSIPNWKISESSQIEMNEQDFCTLEFQEIKCSKHPDAPISNICLATDCKEEHQFCQNCIKLHLGHTTKVIFVKQIEKLIRRNSNVNEIVQDKEGLEAYQIFKTFKKTVEQRLQQLEDELRQIILNLVNDGKINKFGHKFLQSVNKFGVEDLGELRQFLIQEMKQIQSNKVDLQEKPSKQELIQLKNYLSEKIPELQKVVMDNLECVNRTYYIKFDKIERLRKVWICDDGQSKPSVFDKSTVRANVFQVRDRPFYLVGLFQPMLYKGSYNSTNYDSQSKTPKIIFKVHQGLDLTNYIFKQHKALEHEKMKIVDGHLYYIEFRNAIKLLPNQTYTISISTKEAKSFQTYHYSIPVIDHQLIKWQTEDLTDSEQFIKGPYIQHVYSYANIDQIPSLMVKL